MSVNYKVKAIGKPGVAGQGKVKYYATIQRDSKVSFRTLLNRIGNLGFVHSSAVVAVVVALEDAIAHYMKEGKSVQFGNIGTFEPSIKSEPVDEAKDLKAKHIKCLNVNFRLSADFKKSLSDVSFKKVKNDSSTAQA